MPDPNLTAHDALVDKVFMRNLWFLLLAIATGGCTGAKKAGVRIHDPFDAVRVDQMVGNNVSGRVFSRTIVCLNARRETRTVTLVTNQTVALVTNVTLNWITNITFTLSTNRQSSAATNIVAAPPRLPVGETNSADDAVATLSMPLQPASTNTSLATTHNLSTSKAGNQTIISAGAQQQRSLQVSITHNTTAVTTAENENTSADTNLVITVTTNVAVTAVTNVSVTPTNLLVHDYFLSVEYTPPPDFTLQAGESLVLLVDGSRHGLTQATSQSVVVPRRGFSAALYRATPQLLVDIANARHVKLRLKGANALIEETLSTASRANFRKFLLKYFTPETAGCTTATTVQPSS